MLIRDAEFAAIDFESAGARPGATDVPVQVGTAILAADEIAHDTLFRSYLGTDEPITWAAQKVHGITTENLAGAPTLMQLWPRISGALGGRIAVAHGSGTEKRFLRTFPLHGFDTWVDTLKVAHAAYPEADSHSLGDLVTALGLATEVDQLCPDLQWHDALYDAVGSLVLLKHIIAESDLAGEPIETLITPDRARYYSRRR